MTQKVHMYNTGTVSHALVQWNNPVTHRVYGACSVRHDGALHGEYLSSWAAISSTV